MVKKEKEKCIKCQQELKSAPIAFGAMSLFDNREMMYCDNLKCERYQIVIVVNIQK